MRNAGRVPEWDLADKMRKALREAEIGVGEMADYLGVARNTVGSWINGHQDPTKQTLRLWVLKTGVSYEWLTGEPDDDPLQNGLAKSQRKATKRPRQGSNLRPTAYMIMSSDDEMPVAA